jgi:two-component system cell cycle sensor histidine kinase/response regulator CckA
MDTTPLDNEPDDHHIDLLHALPHPVAVVRVSDGGILTANHQFCADFGLPAKALPEKAIAGISDRLLENKNTGAPVERFRIHMVGEHAIQVETPGGVDPTVRALVQPLRYGGQDCWLVTAPVDAGRPADATQEVKEKEHYRSLVENLNDILYTTDTNAVVTYISPNVCQLSGYTPSEVIGKNFVEFVHPDDLSERMEQFLKILKGGTQATEYRLFTKDGTIKWARTHARPIRQNGQVVGVQGILVDITDRKEMEAALIRSEEKYRILVQHAKDAIFVLQGEHIKFMNPVALEVLGYTCESIADRSFIEFVHPDDRRMIMDRYVRRLKGEDLSDRVVFRILNKEDEVRDVDLNSVLITWEKKPAVLNFLRDITIQKRMETQLRNSQKMEALGTLAGGIAHNFNNLLMGIHGNASLALMRMEPSDKNSKYLERINKLVNSGSKLTNQLLDYARGGSCEVDNVDINGLVGDASETLAATRKQIRIHYRLAKDLPCIRVDRGQIEQALLNLLLNAADAMPDGGDVTIETSLLPMEQVKENIALTDKREYVLLKVSDCGIGIPEKIIDRIFEPFFTTKGLDRGTGLGLSTAYGIAKNHKGIITVESVLNKGSSFSVYLPAASEDSNEQVETIAHETVAGKGTVFLVDDDLMVMEATSELLELMGYRVLEAYDGPEALDLFREHWQQIDLVILDLILPALSGKDLFYKMKAVHPEVKVLLSSGFSMVGQAEELLDVGCRGFIQKPYHHHQLSAKIMEILSAD